MLRLRIILGVASSFVAVAALSIVLAGTGQAQGNGNGLPNGPNVVVVNTPLPVTGNVTATLAGNVSATIINPSDNPVLIRDVDARSPKELWQMNKEVIIPVGDLGETITFLPVVPAAKTLIIEHVNVFFTKSLDESEQTPQAPSLILVRNSNPFGASLNSDFQYLVPQPAGKHFIADTTTKFYVGSGQLLEIFVGRGSDVTGRVGVIVTATGYLVNYP